MLVFTLTAGSRVNKVQLSLSTTDGVNKYTASFDGGTSITVSSSDNMLELELSQTSGAQGQSKGLLGKRINCKIR